MKGNKSVTTCFNGCLAVIGIKIRKLHLQFLD